MLSLNTGGWDIVYGCSSDVLNSRLAASKDKFAIKINGQFTGLQFNGEFTDWRFVNGGASDYVIMEITSSGKVGDIYSYNNMISKVRIALSFLRNDESSGNIVLDYSANSIQILEIDGTGIISNNPDISLLPDFLKDVYTKAIQENSDKLEFTMAEITDINTSGLGLKQFRYTWYQPIHDSMMGFLVILGVMDDRDISKLPLIVDHALLYDSNNNAYKAVFLLSTEKFMSEFMVKAMPAIFSGSHISDYNLSGDKIVNNGNIPLTPVKSGAISYDPYISSFDFHIDDDKTVTVLSGRCPIKGLTNAYVDFSLTSKNLVQYNTVNNLLILKADPNFSVTANSDIPSWEKWIGILSLGVLNLVIECVTDALESDIKDRLVNYSLNARTLGIDAVHWGVDLSICNGGFSDNLYIRCD